MKFCVCISPGKKPHNPHTGFMNHQNIVGLGTKHTANFKCLNTCDPHKLDKKLNSDKFCKRGGILSQLYLQIVLIVRALTIVNKRKVKQMTIFNY